MLKHKYFLPILLAVVGIVSVAALRERTGQDYQNRRIVPHDR